MKTLSRRTFLRGAGVALGLPLLEAMPASAGASAGGEPPVRMCLMYFPNGVWEKDWVPAKAGADYDLPFALQPLAPHKPDVLVLTGLDKAHSHQGDGHYAKTANYLTGLPVFKTTGKDLSVGGASVDQLCAQLEAVASHHRPRGGGDDQARRRGLVGLLHQRDEERER